jgi:lysophospholipase L1-like esterase
MNRRYLPALGLLSLLSACTVGSYSLTLSANGSGSTSPAVGAYSYAYGTSLVVTAAPASGAIFTGWSGAALDAILKVTKPGDYLLLQFGTNDGNKTATYSDGMPYYLSPEDFKTYIAQYVTGARDHQAIPVLVTPPPRRACDVNNDTKPFGNGTGGYATAMKEVGAQMNAAVVDLNQKTLDYLNSIGCAASARVFLVVPAGMYPGVYANGVSDGTHFQEYGARKLAGFQNS